MDPKPQSLVSQLLGEDVNPVVAEADRIWEESSRMRHELAYDFARQFRKQLLLNFSPASSSNQDALELVVETLVHCVENAEVKPSDLFSGEEGVPTGKVS